VSKNYLTFASVYKDDNRLLIRMSANWMLLESSMYVPTLGRLKVRRMHWRNVM
jgi:hypothetical protein